jgi:hypothetical protein
VNGAAKSLTCRIAKSMSRRTCGGTSAARRSISARPSTMSPSQPSRRLAYVRTASSPCAPISASISLTTFCAVAVSLSGVLVAFFR